MSYKTIPAKMLSKYIDFNHKTILEIGGDAKFEAATEFVELGAKHVFVSNIAHGIQSAKSTDKITALYADALHLDKTFNVPFDVVFGVAVLEHIPQPERYLKQIYDLLVPGGYVCLTGGPIWTGPFGHHLWVKGEKCSYKFSDESTNVIPHWAHLLLPPESLRDSLQKNSDIPHGDVDKIIEWIFKSQNINRLSYDDLKEAIQNSAFEVIEFNENKTKIPDALKNILELRHGKKNDYSVMGLRVVLRRA